MKIGDEVFVHGYVDEIRKDCIIIRNDGGYFGTVPSEVFCYEEDRNGYGTLNEADTPQMDIHSITDCYFCKHGSEEWDSEVCAGCCNVNNHFEPKDEPQKERSE